MDLELLLVADEDAGPAATVGAAEVAGVAVVPGDAVVVVVPPPAPVVVAPPVVTVAVVPVVAVAAGGGVVPELVAGDGEGVGVPEETVGAIERGFAWKNDQMRPFASNTPIHT